MSKKFFILFQQIGKLPPKLFKTTKTIQRYQQQKPQYKVRQCDSQIVANEALLIYKAQHERFILNERKKKAQEKLKNIDVDADRKKQFKNRLLESVLQVGEFQPRKEQPLSRPKFLPLLTKQQLQLQKLNLMTLTPSMQKLLHYHTSTPVTVPISPSLIYQGNFDGCSKFNPGPSGVGYFITHNDKTVLEGCWPLGTKTNNQAEFLALLYLLVDAHLNGIKKVSFFGDSKIVIEISKGRMQAAHQNIVEYAQATKKMLQLFEYKKLEHVQRAYNSRADKLSNEALKKKFQKQLNKRLY